MFFCKLMKAYLWRFLFLQGLLHDTKLILCSRMTLWKTENANHPHTGLKPVKKVKRKRKTAERDNWLWSQKQPWAWSVNRTEIPVIATHWRSVKVYSLKPKALSTTKKKHIPFHIQQLYVLLVPPPYFIHINSGEPRKTATAERKVSSFWPVRPEEERTGISQTSTTTDR